MMLKNFWQQVQQGAVGTDHAELPHRCCERLCRHCQVSLQAVFANCGSLRLPDKLCGLHAGRMSYFSDHA